MEQPIKNKKMNFRLKRGLRRIKQISSTYSLGKTSVFALCDDGTIWSTKSHHVDGDDWDDWVQLKEIPQPK